MGLKTLVREELKRRGLTWDRKAPVANGNRKAGARLDARVREYEATIARVKDSRGFTRPGSMQCK